MPRKTTAVAKSTRFEDALEELEDLVRSLESGEQSLDESLTRFERGVALSRFCRHSLAEAERQVKILLEEEDGERLADLDASPAGEASGDAPSSGRPASEIVAPDTSSAS